MTEIRAVTTWFTTPNWTTAHNLELDSTMGSDRHYRTLCGRNYPLAEPAFDLPTQAPDDMPRCRTCMRVDDHSDQQPIEPDQLNISAAKRVSQPTNLARNHNE